MGESKMKVTRDIIKGLVKEAMDNQEQRTRKPLFETAGSSYAMHKLDETTMTALQGKYNKEGFIVLTSDRTCAAEMGLPYGSKCPEDKAMEQEKINLQNREVLKQQIRSAGFGFTPTLGGYKEKIEKDGKVSFVDTDRPEHSFLIMARNDKPGLDYESLKKFGIEMANKYNQDSFFFKPPDRVDTNSYYVMQDGSIDMAFSGRTFGDTEQEYYTQLAKGSEKYDPKKRFTALPESLMFPLPPLNASEARSRRGEIFVPRKRGDK
jgi:hypothetical protein